MGIFSRRKLSPEDEARTAFDAGRFADAAALYRELATSGNAQAQFQLAKLYERGQGVPQSFVDAVHWFTAAA